MLDNFLYKRIILVLLFFTSISLLMAEINYDSWFKFSISQTAEKAWQENIRTDINNLETLNIFSISFQSDKKIMVFINGQASWSDTAMKKILEVYADKRFFPLILVANYKKDKLLLQKYLKKAEDEKINLIFTIGSSVLADVYQAYKGKKIPVVSVCNKDPVLLGYIKDYENGSGNNFAFTSVNTPINLQINYLKKLNTNLKNVAILVARSNSSAMKTQFLPLKKELLNQNINVVDVILGPEKKVENLDQIIGDQIKIQLPRVMLQLKKADPGLKNTLFWLTYSTSVVRNLTLLNQLTQNTPIIGVATDTVQNGDNSAAIGIGVSFKSNAYIAAIYGLNIIEGKQKAGELKVGLVSPPDIAINFKIAKKMGFRIPFGFFENANIIYDYEGKKVRDVEETLK